MGQACSPPSGKNSSSSNDVATPPLAKESVRPSEDADERGSAKAQDLNPSAVPHVIPVLRAADTENEPCSSSRRMDTDHGRARGPIASPGSEQSG